MKKEYQIFHDFLRERGLRQTLQRETILSGFLHVEKHISLEDLYKLARRKGRNIGYTTVYRTMKLLAECGLCEAFDPGDGTLRYEHKYNHKHHDHLVCMKCGRFTEMYSREIEKLQEEMAKKYGFKVSHHSLEIFGLCFRCFGGR